MEDNNSEKILSVADPVPSKKGKLFFNKIIPILTSVVGIIIVLLIIGGGALLAGHVWNPKWNPFKQSSQTITIKNILKK